MNNFPSLDKCVVSISCKKKKKQLCLPYVLSVTLHKVRGGCWDLHWQPKDILPLLELQQAEQMVFSSIAHHSLSFPSSCPIVHFSYLAVTLGWIQHLLKLVENLPLTLFGFESCFLWSLLPLAMSEPRSLLWLLNGLDYVCASFSFYFLYFSKGLSRAMMGKAVWNRYFFIQKVERKPVIFFSSLEYSWTMFPIFPHWDKKKIKTYSAV